MKQREVSERGASSSKQIVMGKWSELRVVVTDQFKFNANCGEATARSGDDEDEGRVCKSALLRMTALTKSISSVI